MKKACMKLMLQNQKKKIMMKAEFVALYSLLDKHRVNDQENKTVLNNNELSFKPVNKTNILISKHGLMLFPFTLAYY